jgi:hypothetical protein
VHFDRLGARFDKLSMAFDWLGPLLDRLGLRCDGISMAFDRLRLGSLDRLGLRFDGLCVAFDKLRLRLDGLSFDPLSLTIADQPAHPGRPLGEPGGGCGPLLAGLWLGRRPQR